MYILSGVILLNIIDRQFYDLAAEIKSLGERELYYKIRRSFDSVPDATKKSCADFFNAFGYWGRLAIRISIRR